MYRGANRKWGSRSRTRGSPPYFHFRFDRWRPPDARFRRISARSAGARLRGARRSVRGVEVVRRCARRPPESSVRRVRSRQVWRTLLNESVLFVCSTLHPYGKNFGSIFVLFLNIDFRENRNERSPGREEPTCKKLGKSNSGILG